MSDIKKFDPPKPGVGDAAHAVARAGLGALPIAGTASTELLSALVAPPLEKRRNKWMQEVGEALRTLEAQMGVVLESLSQNDQFVDMAIEATQIAIKTSIQEKREALKNAVLNAALPNPPEDSLQSMFLSFIETLTVWHLKLLQLFNDPQEYIEKQKVQFNISMGALNHLVEKVFPELVGRRDLYDLIWKDLYSRALVTTDSLHGLMTGSGVVAKRTTQIGDMFLEFIKDPIEEP